MPPALGARAWPQPSPPALSCSGWVCLGDCWALDQNPRLRGTDLLGPGGLAGLSSAPGTPTVWPAASGGSVCRGHGHFSFSLGFSVSPSSAAVRRRHQSPTNPIKQEAEARWAESRHTPPRPQPLSQHPQEAHRPEGPWGLPAPVVPALLVTCRCCSFRRAVFQAAAGSVLVAATTFPSPAQVRRSVKCMGPVTSILPVFPWALLSPSHSQGVQVLLGGTGP